MLIISRIINVKVNLRLNITNEFQDRLAIYHVSISADDENLLYSKRSTKKVLPKSKIIKKNFFNYFPFYIKNSKNIINHCIIQDLARFRIIYKYY